MFTSIKFSTPEVFKVDIKTLRIKTLHSTLYQFFVPYISQSKSDKTILASFYSKKIIRVY